MALANYGLRQHNRTTGLHLYLLAIGETAIMKTIREETAAVFILAIKRPSWLSSFIFTCTFLKQDCVQQFIAMSMSLYIVWHELSIGVLFHTKWMAQYPRYQKKTPSTCHL